MGRLLLIGRLALRDLRHRPVEALLVLVVALALAALATLASALRAARTSTVRALADVARTPRRHARLTALSASLPVPLLLAARRPRRSLLSGVSVAITVTTLITVLIYRASDSPPPSAAAADGPSADPVSQVMLVLTVALVILAAVNAVFIAWATVVDTRYPGALARVLGATPNQLRAGLSASQLLPALPGAVIGVPAGVGLYAAVSNGGAVTMPSALWVGIAIAGTLLAMTLLTAIPARFGTHSSVAKILRSAD